MKLKEELKHVSSEYLCAICKEPLYFELKSKDDSCINPECILFPLLKFHSVDRATVLKQQFRDKASKLKLKMSRTDGCAFANFLHRERRAAIGNLLHGGRTQFEKILVIDEMLILINHLKLVGRKRKPTYFQRILKDFTWLFRVENQIEDLKNMRNLLTVDNEIYILKYWTAIMELYKSYGIVVGRKTDLAEAFKYARIDREVKEKVKFRPGMKMEEIFEQEFDTITGLKYILEGHFRTAKQHSYDPTALDIAVLLGLFFSVGEDVEGWPEEAVRRHYQNTVTAQDKMRGDFTSFKEKYAISKRVAPIMIFDGRSYILDKETLFFYILYLVGQNRRIVEGQKAKREDIIVRKKQQASKVFEDHIRRHLRDCGFKGPDQPLVISEQKEKYEFDVVGVREDQKQVLLVEAKYRDLSPSSLTGKTLIRQELFDQDNGLLVEAIRHQQRLDFFLRYPHRFKSKLSLQSSPNGYQVYAWIVTKQMPLISKYRQILLSDYDDFCNRLQQMAE